MRKGRKAFHVSNIAYMPFWCHKPAVSNPDESFMMELIKAIEFPVLNLTPEKEIFHLWRRKVKKADPFTFQLYFNKFSLKVCTSCDLCKSKSLFSSLEPFYMLFILLRRKEERWSDVNRDFTVFSSHSFLVVLKVTILGKMSKTDTSVFFHNLPKSSRKLGAILWKLAARFH